MTRIFTTLATINMLVLTAAFALGLTSMFRQAASNPADSTYWIHFLLGLGGAITTLLVHCLIFTYFLGTGRWVKEVAVAYQLPDDSFYRLTRELKRWTFPPALFAMLITIAAAAAGAGVQMQRWPWTVHFTLAIGTLLANAWASWIEYRNVKANGEVLDKVLVEVDRIRAERGLPPNAEAWEEQERVG